MRERCIKIDRVVMAAPFSPNVEHPCPPQIAEESPHRTMSQRHRFGDLIGRAIRFRSYVEENGAMAGNKIEASDVTPLFGSISKASKE
jgi:hypothetical protein